MLRSLSGGRRCNGTLPTRTVSDMRWGTWGFGWLGRRTVAWFWGCRRRHRRGRQASRSPFQRDNRLALPNHTTRHLLLLLTTPASNRFAPLGWSTVVVAKCCTRLPTTPQRPSTDVPAVKITVEQGVWVRSRWGSRGMEGDGADFSLVVVG